MSPIYSPQCPNHHVPLIKTNDKHIGICPISQYRFSYNSEDGEKKKKLRKTAFGTVEEVPDFDVKPLDGNDG